MTRSNSELIARLRQHKGLSWQEHDELADRLEAIDQALPPCPRCGGRAYIWVDSKLATVDNCPPCPDCDRTGRVSVADLAALWGAVRAAMDVRRALLATGVGDPLADHLALEAVADIAAVRAQRPSETTP